MTIDELSVRLLASLLALSHAILGEWVDTSVVSSGIVTDSGLSLSQSISLVALQLSDALVRCMDAFF